MTTIQVSNADRVVFPEIGKTKGDVVAYYERVAPRLLPHVTGRPISLLRFPKGLAAPGFFQKNVPAHYPASIERFAVPRSTTASKRHRDPEARERHSLDLARDARARSAHCALPPPDGRGGGGPSSPADR